MIILLLILSVLLTLTSAWLFWQFRAQKALINEVLQDNPGPDYNREPEPILTLKVIDPIALARRESRSARMLADHLPVMVTRLVYQQVIDELEKELEQRDIAVTMQMEYR